MQGSRAERGGRAGWSATPSTLRRLVLVTALSVLACTWSGTAKAAPTIPPTQQLVTLYSSQAVRSAPSASATSLVTIAALRPITGVRTVLPVLGHATGGWLRVRLPGRPNGGTGWIRTRATAVAVTPWHIVVDTVRRRVLVYRAGRVARIFRAVVGKSSSPTPAGSFFVEEAVSLSPGDIGAPFALALSARSDVYQEFDGGPGQIALHGLANIGGVPGTAVSHGCVRLDGGAMRWLVARIGPGVPVTITS
jgi:lipoprotein-anchoring transpeptidase ErfK/SrfK